jgi:aminoglycoside 6'-N-acetyltransferase
MRIAEGAPALAIDPDAENDRARRAYAHAGFVGDDVAETDDRPVVVMVFRPRPDATIGVID